MARTMGRLTALGVSRIHELGLYPDGGGLALRVTRTGTRSWVYRFMLHGKAREMGLGSASLVSLAEARAKAVEAGRLRASGVDPIEARASAMTRIRLDKARALTFKEAAEAFLASHRAGWRSAQHAHDWQASLAEHVYPGLGSLPIAEIDTEAVLRVLTPVWTTKPETASRIRGRIESVLSAARALGHIPADKANPATWRGHLDHLLPARSKVRPVVHHAALPYGELPGFMARLKQARGPAAQALQLVVLTAARRSEVTGMVFDEVDLASRIWTVPAGRTKSGREHRVPLSDAALAIIAELAIFRRDDRGGGLIFEGRRAGRPLGHMAMLKVLADMDRSDLTVHGFRSSFRDWVAEETSYPREIAEAALGHVVGDQTERAYRRGDALEKRRQLMDAWAAFLARPVGENVVNLPARAVSTGE